ncbi:MAG: EAL domain-containing protein, partial [Gammaproteobacteria bacterium]|nr:EAL domain-containing protein [Gammaproteobacteria bacterium]
MYRNNIIDFNDSTSVHRGLELRVILFSIILLLLVGAVTWQMVSQSQTRLIEYQARELAEVVSRFAASARSVYAKEVVQKLKQDGFGSRGQYHDIKGFVPLPAQFLKYLGTATANDTAGLYRYKPVSKWNLESSQGLNDDFKRWAWSQLEAQDKPNPATPIQWQPAWRIETIDGVKTLRYLRADPAVGQSCVDCHNAFELREEVRQRRINQGIDAGKQWRLNQLMGAIEVAIPLNRVHAMAKSQMSQTFVLIVGVVLAGLAVIGFFIFSDVTRARRMARQLSWQASHDGLTALVNRSEFERRLQRALDKVNIDHNPHALLFLDLDNFKVVNDTSGHMAGDELLRQLGQLLKADIRIGDTLARLGGDEFGVLLENCAIDEAKKVAEKLRQSIEDYRFCWEARSFDIGVSIGLITVTEQNRSVAELLSSVDLACYAAKESGRNRVEVLSSEQEIKLKRTEIEWATRITHALENGLMGIAIQDAVALQTNQKPIRYQEVLLRMRDQSGQPVNTAGLIGAAERYNVMPGIDRWVIRHVFGLIRDGILKVDSDRYIAINLSGNSINDPKFLAYVQSQFWEFFEVPPSYICFEITETAAVGNLVNAKKFIRTLKHLGCHFALDDFGSGLSSYRYLRSLPVDFLKIDGKFVKDMQKNALDFAMVEAMVKIATVMGIPVIGEWVENQKTKDMLT